MNLLEIIDNMPKNLTKIEQARYIYIELCKKIVYDPEYLINKNIEKRRKMFDEEANIETWSKNKAICSTISKIYLQLLQKVGIDSRTIHHADEDYLRSHVFYIFY